jgi:hypothetical protein
VAKRVSRCSSRVAVLRIDQTNMRSSTNLPRRRNTMLVRSAVVTLSVTGALVLPLSAAAATATSAVSVSHATATTVDGTEVSQNWLPVHSPR